MKRRIRIGYVGNSYSWEQLLEQLGADWKRLEPGDSVSVQDFSCVIVDRPLNRIESSSLNNYLDNGGAMIDADGSFCGYPITSKSFKEIVPSGDESLFAHINNIPVYGKARIHRSSAVLKGTIWFDTSVNRNLAFCGLPVSRLWSNFKTVHRMFGYSDAAITAERTAALQSHPYFEVVLSLLRILHDKSGLPFVHKWWHPEAHKQTATLRIDTDYGDFESIKIISNTAKGYDIPLTWFVHTEHHEPYLDKFIDLLSVIDEIALHCYSHSEYKTSGQYLSDIKNGLKLLNEHGLEPLGYAAPYGNWSESFAESLQKFSFLYTSEFSYDFDSLPSVSSSSGILQLPVHPVTIGSFRRFKSNPSDIQAYFRKIVRRKRLQNQPVHLYHHPLDGSPKQWQDFINFLKPDRYLVLTYSQWSEWWKKRSAVNLDIFFDIEEGGLTVSNHGNGGVPLSIHRDGSYSVSELNEGPVHLEELSFRPYIEPELKEIIHEQRTAPEFSKYRRLKDKMLTRMWRNRT